MALGVHPSTGSGWRSAAAAVLAALVVLRPTERAAVAATRR